MAKLKAVLASSFTVESIAKFPKPAGLCATSAPCAKTDQAHPSGNQQSSGPVRRAALAVSAVCARATAMPVFGGLAPLKHWLLVPLFCRRARARARPTGWELFYSIHFNPSGANSSSAAWGPWPPSAYCILNLPRRPPASFLPRVSAGLDLVPLGEPGLVAFQDAGRQKSS